MKFFLAVLLSVSFASAHAQWGDLSKMSAVSRSYHAYRQEATEPPYGLAKIKSLLRRLKADSEENEPLQQNVYENLTTEQKFTYTMLHGENASQNCDAMPGIVDEENKLFAFPLGAFNDNAEWSDRQRGFLKRNRRKVIQLLRSTIRLRHRVGVNLKQAILEIQAVELIPDLAAVYREQRKDHDILTVMMLLMKQAKYKPFLATATYKKLYGNESSSYKAYIEANRANQELEIQRAMSFYNARTR